MSQTKYNSLDTLVTTKDLNAIDALNGSGSVAFKGIRPELKGALSQYAKSTPKQTISDEETWIYNYRLRLKRYEMERFNYSGLPLELDKYRLEEKILSNGSTLIIQDKNAFYACNYTMTNWNMYNEPTTVIVNEPKIIKSLRNKSYIVGVDAAIIRNNIDRTSYSKSIERMLQAMEKTLYMIEKSVTSGEGKIGINTENVDIDEVEDLVKKLNEASVDTDKYFSFSSKNTIGSSKINSGTADTILQLTSEDRTDSLWKIFNNLKEQVKEEIGAEVDGKDKAERKITSEVSAQQAISIAQRQHDLDIRKNDIEKVNELFNVNWMIEDQPDAMESEDAGDEIQENTKERKGGE